MRCPGQIGHLKPINASAWFKTRCSTNFFLLKKTNNTFSTFQWKRFWDSLSEMSLYDSDDKECDKEMYQG